MLHTASHLPARAIAPGRGVGARGAFGFILVAVLLFGGARILQAQSAGEPPPGGGDAADSELPPTDSSPPAAAFESRIPIRMVGGKMVARVELSTRFRRIPAHLWIEYDRPISLELHNRAADPLGVDRDGGQPVTVHLLGDNLTIDGREHGDEEAMENYTKLYSRELGEVSCVGSIGAKVLENYHVTFDLADGFITLGSPAERTGAAPPEVEGSIVTSISLTNDLVWFPVRLANGEVRAMAIGTTVDDSRVDRELAENLQAPAGDIGPVLLKTLDLHNYVALRPEPLVQVHPDGVLGIAGVNLLAHFRVEIDRVNRTVRFTETVPAEFPTADLAFFRARAEEEPEPLIAYLEEFGESRLAREAAPLLLALQIELGAEAEACRIAIEWIHKTRIEDLRTTEALATMKMLLEERRPDLAIIAGKMGVESGRKDRYPEAVHKLHTQLGELLLERGEGSEAWEHLLSAAFGLPDDGEVKLLLGRLYEQQGRWRRAQSQYIQAVITPETGPQAIEGLERLQEQMEGEPLSVDLVDRMIQGKVHNFSAATKFESTPETDNNRCVLVELYTNPHFGRKQGENWEGFAIGGSMAMEGVLSHFPRERAVVLVHHIDLPEPCALMTDLGMHSFQMYGLEGPVSTVIDGGDFGPGAQRWRKAEEVYEANRALVSDHLTQPSEVELAIDATLADDGTVRGTVRVTAPDARLLRVQVVLAERGVLYPGKSVVVVNRMVARGSVLDSIDGVRLENVEGEQTISFTRTLAEITAANVAFLDAYEQNGGGAASRLSVKIDPRQVSLVAFIRNAATLKVLQAVQLDLGKGTDEGGLR